MVAFSDLCMGTRFCIIHWPLPERTHSLWFQSLSPSSTTNQRQGRMKLLQRTTTEGNTSHQPTKGSDSKLFFSNGSDWNETHRVGTDKHSPIPIEQTNEAETVHRRNDPEQVTNIILSQRMTDKERTQPITWNEHSSTLGQ